MRRVDRYVIRAVLELSALVALVLLSVYLLASFVADLGSTGQNGFSVYDLVRYTLLLAPSALYLLLPLIALLGTLMGLGALARQGELTAMRAAGVSLLRIGGATLIAGVLLGAAGFIIGDWLAPAGERAAAALHGDRGPGPGGAIWLRDADSVVRIGRLDSERTIADVTVFRMQDGRLAEVFHAADGRYQDGRWVFRDVRASRLDADGVGREIQPQRTWSGGVTPSVLRLFILEEDSLSTAGLLRLIHYLDDNRLDAEKYRLLLWRKLFEPLTVMAMMLFAVPFVSSVLRDAGAGQRLLLGLLVGVAFYVVNKVSVSFGEIYRWNPALAAGAPAALLLLAAVWQLRRAP